MIMLNLQRLIYLLTTICCLMMPTASFALDDPDIPWLVQESDHFIIHYPASRALLATRALSIAEEAWERLTPLQEWKPREKTNISVIDTYDLTNGWARVVSANHIRLYTYPPSVSSELGDYDDWIRQLIYHEYTHILHMDTAGIAHHVVDLIIGKIAKYNMVMPTWYTEGMAVYYETLCSDSGRLRNTIYRTMLRNAALSDSIPKLSKLSMGTSAWPGGAAQYLYGAFFISYIASHYGRDTLTTWNHRYGNRIVPFFLSVTAKNIWHKSLDDLYDEWRKFETERANAEIEAAKAQGDPTPHQSFIQPHRHKRPQIIPNANEISYVHSDGYHMQAIVRYNPETNQSKDLVQCSGECEHHWNSDGTKLYFVHTTTEDGFRFRDKLYVYDKTKDRVKDMELPDHVRTFALDTDNTLYWVVQNNESNALYRMAPEQPFELIYKTRPFEQIDDLSVRDGHILASVFDPDTRQYDIEKLEISYPNDSHGTIVNRENLTETKSPEMSPQFCAENAVCYISAKNDYLNLYKYDLQTKQTVRITHLLDGILHPVVDRSGDIYYTQYTPKGTTIAKIDAGDTSLYPDQKDLRPATQIYPELYPVSKDGPEREHPWQWMFPRRWMPNITSSPDMGWAYGITFWGHDEIDHHNYSFSSQYLPKKDTFNLAISYQWNSLPWGLGLDFSLAQNIASYFDTRKIQQFDYQTTTASIYGSRTFNQRMSTHQIALRYVLQYNEAQDPLSWYRRDPASVLPILPSLGWNNALVLGWSWSNRRQTELAFVANYGASLSSALRIEAPWLGADEYSLIWYFTYLQSETMPYLNSHTLNTEATVGLSWSQNPKRMPFTISSDRGYVFNTTGADTRLHGYPIGLVYGKNNYYFHVDYTAMLYDFELTYSTFPAAIDRIALSPFADWGYAWNNTFNIKDSKYDVGCKLYIDLVLAYAYTFRLSLGYAWGGSKDGGHELFFYWQMR